MKEILYIENEFLLSRLEEELKILEIDHFVKKTDSSILPSNINKIYCAILFSDIENKDKILEIYENIKSSQIIEVETKNKSNYLYYIFFIQLFTIITIAIIIIFFLKFR